MRLWVCAGCGCRYAAGAPRCPECPETVHEETETEVPNITSAGLFFEPGHEPPGWVPPQADSEPEAEPVPEPDAPAVPAAPPRRVPQTEG